MFRLPTLFLRATTLLLIALTASSQDESDAAAPRLQNALESLNARIAEGDTRGLHQRAEVYFRLGRYEDAITDYDASVETGWPHDDNACWERGLAQYYAGEFREAAEQFERYHRVGALDIENGLWRLLCIAEEHGIEKGREALFDYPRKVRPPFPALLDLFLGNGDVDAVMEEARSSATSEQEHIANLFNAHYYLGKYYEITRDHARALDQFTESLKYPFPHFMYACAQADAKRMKEKLSE